MAESLSARVKQYQEAARRAILGEPQPKPKSDAELWLEETEELGTMISEALKEVE